MNLTLSQTVTVPLHVMARTVGEDVVILDLQTGMYFGLDSVGARAWSLLTERRSIRETCEIMLEEFAVEREQIEMDILELVRALEEAGLVLLDIPPAPNPL